MGVSILADAQYPNNKGTSRSGGTGRRARLKLVFLRECGFDSHLRHYTLTGHYVLPFAGFEKRETNWSRVFWFTNNNTSVSVEKLKVNLAG